MDVFCNLVTFVSNISRDSRDTRFRGYDVKLFLEFHVQRLFFNSGPGVSIKEGRGGIVAPSEVSRNLLEKGGGQAEPLG